MESPQERDTIISKRLMEYLPPMFFFSIILSVIADCITYAYSDWVTSLYPSVVHLAAGLSFLSTLTPYVVIASIGVYVFAIIVFRESTENKQMSRRQKLCLAVGASPVFLSMGMFLGGLLHFVMLAPFFLITILTSPGKYIDWVMNSTEHQIAFVAALAVIIIAVTMPCVYQFFYLAEENDYLETQKRKAEQEAAEKAKAESEKAAKEMAEKLSKKEPAPE